MILVAIGSNLPHAGLDNRALAEAAFSALGEAPLHLAARSRLWRTRPVPDTGQPWFVNAVAAIETDLLPEALLDHLHAVERRFGRLREAETGRNAPRTLDLDLIDYHRRVSAGERLILPHPRLGDRAFVLRPLAEIAPGWRHPVTNHSVGELIDALPADQIAEPIKADMVEIMGIVNVTPDSFSDGGMYATTDAAVAHGLALLRDGATILDIGGESTRPGARPLYVEEELARVVPVIERLRGPAQTVGARLSVDTRNAATMAAALGAGAWMINDVTALTHDPRSLEIAASGTGDIVLMHMQGTPETMQLAPTYNDVVAEVRDWLHERVRACEAAGIARSRLIVDPGIGFGKTVEHNLALLAHLPALAALGTRVMVGASRKQFIARLSRSEVAADRLGGSLAVALFAAQHGAHILRVHDVAETAQGLRVWQALQGAQS